MRKSITSLTKFLAAVFLAAGLAGDAAAQFTGSFAGPQGASYDGGDMDAGWATAVYNSEVYVVGASSPTGGILVRYDAAGNKLYSATLPGVELSGVAVNANGVYVVGSSTSSFIVAKYDHALGFITSQIVGAVAGAGADIALSPAGNVFVVGNKLSPHEYLIGMYNSNLAMMSESGFGSGGVDTGTGVTVDGTDVYMAGHSLIGGATYFVLAKYSETDYLSTFSSAAFAGSYADIHPMGGKLAVNPVTHALYAADNSSHYTATLMKYDQSLALQGTPQSITSTDYAQASDVALDAAGNVYLVGSYNDGTNPDYAMIKKYDQDLVLQSSTESVQGSGYEGIGIAIDPVTGYGYVTGISFSDVGGAPAVWDMRTVRFGGPAGAGFSGNFTSGADLDNGDRDAGQDVAVYNSQIYVAGNTTPDGGIIVRYDQASVVQSSVTMSGVEFYGIAVNANGVYVTGNDGTDAVTAKFTHNLLFVSSRTSPGLPGGRDIALDASGNAFVAASEPWGGQGGLQYKVLRYDQNLGSAFSYSWATSDGSASMANASGIAVDGSDVYLSGYSMMYAQPVFVVARLDSSSGLTYISSADYSGGYLDEAHPLGPKVAVNHATKDVYLVAGENYDTPLIIRYGQDLGFKNYDYFYTGEALNSQASDVALDQNGNVYVTGPYRVSASEDYPLLRKYSPELVFLSSSAVTGQPYGYEPLALAIATATGRGYVTGVYFSDGDSMNSAGYDMRTVGLDPLGGGGTISGTLSYAGSKQGPAIVAVFASSDIANSEPAYYISIDTSVAQPWTFTTPPLPAGTYYLASVMFANGHSTQEPGKYDPWAVLGTALSPTPVAVDAAALTGRDLALVDGTDAVTNPFARGGFIEGSVSYSGSQTGDIKVAVSDQPLGTGAGEGGVRTMSATGGSYSFRDLPMPATYYVTAWMDVDYDGYLTCGEPNGAYQPAEGKNCLYVSKAIYLAPQDGLYGADLSLRDFARVSGEVFDPTYNGGAGVLTATQPAFGFVPFHADLNVISGSAGTPYELTIATSAEPYEITAYLDRNSNGMHDFSEPSGSNTGVMVTSLSPVTGRNISVSAPVLPYPVLSWAGGVSYGAAGAPDGYSGLFVYRVKYTSPNGLAPKSGYPKLTVTTNGVPVTYPMSELSPEDTDYSDGKIYTYTMPLSYGNEYAYTFSAVDTDDIPADPLSASGPIVYEAPVITYSTTTHVLAGITAEVYSGEANGTAMYGEQFLAKDQAGYVYSAQTQDGYLALIKRGGSGVVQTTFIDFGGSTLRDLAVDAAGNSYLLGFTGEEPVVAKFGPLGDQVWVSTFGYGLTPVSLGVSAAGAVYAAANDEVNRSILLFKLLPDGAPAWETPAEYQFSRGLSTDTAAGLSVAPQGAATAVYLAGDTSTDTFVTSGLLLKFLDAGAPVTAPAWVKTYASSSQEEYSRHAAATAVVSDKLGNVYAAGSDSRYDIGQGSDIWLLKYNAAGVPQWSAAKTFNSGSDDSVAALALDSVGSVYLAGKVYSWDGGGNDLWLGKYSSAGVQLMSRVYAQDASDDTAYDIAAGSASVIASAGFNGQSALYELPLAAGAQSSYFTALEGAAAGSVALSWNYPFDMPAGSSFYIQASPAASPVWNRALAQVVRSTQVAQWESQEYIWAGLPTGRDADKNVFPQYKFRVWLSSAPGVYTPLAAAPASFARTPFSEERTLEYGQARFSYMTSVTATPDAANAIAVADGFVYQAFGNDSGDSVGLGFRKQNINTSVVEWTKFFNSTTPAGAYYNVNSLQRDSSGNFYAVGSRAQVDSPNKALWMGKFSAAGDQLWDYSQDVDSGADELRAAVLDGAGGLYVTGEFTDIAGGKGAEILVRKYDVSSAAGPALVFASTQSGFPGGNDTGYGVALDAANARLYVVGALANSAETTDLWAARFPLNLASVSSFTYNSGPGNGAGYGVAVTTYGICVVGSRSDAQGTSVMYSAGYPASMSGTPVWQIMQGPNSYSALRAITVDAAGFAYGSGFEMSQDQGFNAIYGKLSPNGLIVWNRYLNDDTRNADESAYSIQLDTAGRVFSSIRTGRDGLYNPGFYMFPQPSFALQAEAFRMPGAVRLSWISQATLPAGTTFYVQYSTSAAIAWSAASAQVSSAPAGVVWEGVQMEQVVYGLDNGRSAAGADIGPDYYFKVWYSTAAGSYTPVPGLPSVKAPNALLAENAAVYSADSKLFTTGSRYEYDYSQRLNGAVRGPLGNIYSVANTSANDYRVFALRKFSPGGLPVWTKTYTPGDRYSIWANRLASDAAGNIYVTGKQSYWAEWGMGENRMFIARYNADGQLAWKYAGPPNTEGFGIAADNQGHVFVAGSSGTYSGMDAWLAGFDVTAASATLKWEAAYKGAGAGNNRAYGAAALGGVVYAAGSTSENAEFAEDSSLWVARYSAATGARLSTAAVNNITWGEEAAYAVLAAPSGLIYVAGQAYTPGGVNQPGSFDGVVYVSSADLSDFGVTVSTYRSASSQYGAAAAYGLALDAAGGVYATGMDDRSDIAQGRDLWLRKYTPELGAGSDLWTQTFNSYGWDDAGYGVAVDNLGYVYAAGSFGQSDGLYQYKPVNMLTYKPTLTARVSRGGQGAAAVPFAGVDVAFIPYSQTGGIDASGVKIGSTDASGYFSREIPSGRQYFIAISTQGYTPTVKDQQTDPNGTFFVQLAGDAQKEFTLYPASDPGTPLTVLVTSATAGDLVTAEVFFTETGEKVAYSLAQVGVNRSSITFAVPSVATAAANLYTLGVTIPARSIQRAVKLNYAFPSQKSEYTVCMSTMFGAVVSAAGFDVSASTTPASFSGVVRNKLSRAPLEKVRVALYHQGCVPNSYNPSYDEYETMTDVNGKFAFYGVAASTVPYLATLRKEGYSTGGMGGCTFYPSSGTPFGLEVPGVAGTQNYTEFGLDEATFTFKGIITYGNVPVPNVSVTVTGDYSRYDGGVDSYRYNSGMGTYARVRTGADGSFTFSSATANGLLEGNVRLAVELIGSYKDINEGKINSPSVDNDDIRIVLSGDKSTMTVTNCAKGKVWLLSAANGACRAAVNPNTPLTFNIEPPAGETSGLLYGSVVFVTTYTISEQNPLTISTASPIAVMAVQSCNSGNCSDNIRFAPLAGVYTVNSTTYSIALSTGVNYNVKLMAADWAPLTSFESKAELGAITAVKRDFVIGRAGKLKGNIKLPNGNNYKPHWVNSQDDPAYHSAEIRLKGSNVDVSEDINVDENGEFEFSNIAPGTYDITILPHGAGFVWAPVPMEGVSVGSGKTVSVTLQLAMGLVVQPQLVGLPEISTSSWRYVIIPVESGTEMNQKEITSLFFGNATFSFEYSTETASWNKKYMLPGQYDFYLMLGANYDPCTGGDCRESYNQFGNFIGKVKGVTVQRSEANPGLGSYDQPIPVNILGAIGQADFQGTLWGEKVFTAEDCQRIAANFNEIMPLIPAVMIYDAAGDLKGYTAALPSKAKFQEFYSIFNSTDTEACKDYFHANRAEFIVPGLPHGKYTMVFNNPNYPPVAKELELPLAGYGFDFEAQNVVSGSISGTVKSSATLDGVPSAVVYLKHRTVEKFGKTGADGSFRFENLPQGIYRVEVMHEGYVKTGVKTSLSGSDSVDLDFLLTPSEAVLNGKIYMSKFPSPVTKAGVKVVAYDETMNVQAPSAYLPKLEANTNSAGEYELAGLVPGHLYKVAAFYTGKLTTTLDITALEGTTYAEDIVLSDIRPQIAVKVKKSPDSASKVDVTIKSPKKLVTAPVCRFNPSGPYAEYNPASAVTLALVPGANYTYTGQFTVSRNQRYYSVYVLAGDTDKTEKTVLYDQNNEARTEQYIQDEAIRGGEVQMDIESEEYSGIELDPGALSRSTTAPQGAAYSVAAAGGDLVGGFFSGLPSVRTVKTAKGNMTLESAIQDLMASEVYDMDLANSSINKPFTLTLKYEKDKGAGKNLKIYQYDPATGSWIEVPGNYTVDPMLGVVSVDVECLTSAYKCKDASSTPLGRKTYGMSAVVNGRYVPAAGTGTQSGQFAVFTAKPVTNIAYSGGFEVYNMPNPFNLKNKTVTSIQGAAAFAGNSNYSSGTQSYTTKGTLIKYHLPAGKSGSLKFVIYNLAGEKVRTLDDGNRDGGWVYYSEWDGKNDNGADCASGVYFMLTYLDGKQLGNKAHKMALIK